MNAITLNIKCNTVRKIHKTMEVVLATTFALAVIIFFATRIAIVGIDRVIQGIGGIFLVIGIAGIIFCGAIFLSWSLMNIYSVLPAIKCVETEEKQ